jgi:ribosomal protein S18 acetylase RimI-like enzyme
MVELLAFDIRSATESDLPGMEWEGEYRRFRRLYRQAWADVKHGRRLILLAQADGVLIGQIIVQVGANLPVLDDGTLTGYLHAFRVRPAYRNQGVGTRLIQQAEASLRQRRIQRVAIAVDKSNPEARRLYERLGYSFVGEDPGEWTYLDDEGQERAVSEPSYILAKSL